MNFNEFKNRISAGETIYFKLAKPTWRSSSEYLSLYRKYGGRIITANPDTVIRYDTSYCTYYVAIDILGKQIWFPVCMFNETLSFNRIPMDFYDFEKRILDMEAIYFELRQPDPEHPDWYFHIYEKYGKKIIRVDWTIVSRYNPTDRTVLIDMGHGRKWVPTEIMSEIRKNV